MESGWGVDYRSFRNYRVEGLVVYSILCGSYEAVLLLIVQSVYTHRLQSSSFLGVPYRILNMHHKKELLWSLWVIRDPGSGGFGGLGLVAWIQFGVLG